MSNYEQFGIFIAKRRLAKDITLRGMAELIDLSPSYYNEIEKGRRNPPDWKTLIRIAEILNITGIDLEYMFDLVGKQRSEVSPDLPDYIMSNDVVRSALRIARDSASNDDWQKFIKNLKGKRDDKDDSN